MATLLGGCALLVATGFVLSALLPRGDRVSRFVGTMLEPYLAISVVGGFAVGIAMIVAGVIAVLTGANTPIQVPR